MIWFCFIFVINLVLFLFKSTFFKSLLFFSSLSLIILVGEKFNVVIFSGLTFML